MPVCRFPEGIPSLADPVWARRPINRAVISNAGKGIDPDGSGSLSRVKQPTGTSPEFRSSAGKLGLLVLGPFGARLQSWCWILHGMLCFSAFGKGDGSMLRRHWLCTRYPCRSWALWRIVVVGWPVVVRWAGAGRRPCPTSWTATSITPTFATSTASSAPSGGVRKMPIPTSLPWMSSTGRLKRLWHWAAPRCSCRAVTIRS